MYRNLISAFCGLAAAVSSSAAENTAVAPEAVAAARAVNREVPDLLERFVNWLHGFFPGINETMFHWIACAVLFLAAILLRHIITNIIFHYLKKMAAKTETTLDDKLFPALEGPTATLVMVAGIFAALTVLQLSEQVDRWVTGGAKISALAVVLWGMIRAGGAILDHLGEIAHEKHMTVATFMPLIKKTLFVFAVIFGVLVIAQSQGLPVQSFLAGLGIGGLAFALAAQDTIANLFGSFVVVMDQPFKVGDIVKIGANEGKVEDIGLRSTKVRTGARTLIVIPNKSVANEPITNFTRMPQRRVDQTLALTYDTTPDQLEAVIGDIRALLHGDADVHQDTIVVNFANYGASSLDVQLVWFATDPDWVKHMAVRERINLKIMRAVVARGLAFAFPTQTVQLTGSIAQKLAQR
ncbi:MAG: mechanosensitive ion channel family protein [Verrucomicrobiota bacterium]